MSNKSNIIRDDKGRICKGSKLGYGFKKGHHINKGIPKSDDTKKKLSDVQKGEKG